MPRLYKIVVVILLLGLLILIRGFEDSLFYDPLLTFYKSIQGNETLPDFDTMRLLTHITFRYALNTIISMGILWIIFQDKDVIKLSIILYSVLFMLLFIVFCFLIFSSDAGQNLTLFYVRRFLIQPLFLLILIPAFYFQKKFE